MQMLVVIGVMVWLGNYLDQRNNTSTPYYTLVFSLVGIFAAIYFAIKDFIKK